MLFGIAQDHYYYIKELKNMKELLSNFKLDLPGKFVFIKGN